MKNYNSKINFINDKILRLRLEKIKCQRTNIKKFSNMGFLDSTDVTKEREIDLSINKLQFEVEILKARKKYNPFYKQIDKAWLDYENSLNWKLIYLNNERTERIYDSNTGEIEYVVNQTEINRLRRLIENEGYRYQTVIDDNRGVKNYLVKKLKILDKLKYISILLLLYIVLYKFPNLIIKSDEITTIGKLTGYFSSILGALVSGFIAYIVASYQINVQSERKKEEDLLSMKLDVIQVISEKMNKLSAKSDTIYAFITRAYKYETENSVYDINEFKNFVGLIHNDIRSFYEMIEDIGIIINTRRLYFDYLVDDFTYIREVLLKFAREAGSLKHYYDMVIKVIDEHGTVTPNGDVKDILVQLDKNRRKVIEEIYKLESKLQNEQFSFLHKDKVFAGDPNLTSSNTLINDMPFFK